MTNALRGDGEFVVLTILVPNTEEVNFYFNTTFWNAQGGLLILNYLIKNFFTLVKIHYKIFEEYWNCPKKSLQL